MKDNSKAPESWSFRSQNSRILEFSTPKLQDPGVFVSPRNAVSEESKDKFFSTIISFWG